MAINKYNDLSAIFSNHNNNNIDTIFENTSRNMLDVVKASSHDDEIRTSCFYYGLDDLGPSSNEYSSLLDLVHQCSGPVIGRQVVDPSPASSVMPGGESCSEVVNSGPTTPNSISISSSSSEALNEGLPKADDEDKNQDGDDNKSNKQLKAKKKEKKKKEPRFAFMTQTDVDHLDDGYRWRKYGQKAVKNSPFPRSYYRCTTSACGVKKRVERSSEDPSIVVTTYEGQHSHPCPIMTRSGFGLGFGIEAGAGMGTRTFSSQPLDQCNTSPIVFGGYSAAFSSTSHIFPYFHNKYHQQQFPRNYTKFLNPNGSSSLRTLTFKDGGGCHGSSNSIICSLATTISSDGDGRVGVNNLQQSNPIIDNLQLRHIQPPCPTSNSHHQLRDDGLLQDIVPSQMRNKAIKEE